MSHFDNSDFNKDLDVNNQYDPVKGNDKAFNGKYSLNFSISHNDPNFSNLAMSSSIISETTLEEDCILLKKKSLLKRKSLGSQKIYYREILELDLIKSTLSSLYSSIRIVYSKNGYSKRVLSLSSSDGFAVRWFYDALVVKYSYVKSGLDKKYDFNSNESDWIEANESNKNTSLSGDLTNSNDLNDSSIKEDDLNNSNGSNSGDESHNSLSSKQSKLSDFVSQMNKELSEEETRSLKKKMKFERCSSGEY
ncbi:hypothetical protein mru_1793 [Methanobrevibacter ruminantium M1]|uniref:Uncharacterized protein n=1 Tax=Methanobrevibacter ruminantium (strain ATCC 35063 / DSM 1093 / JCM 13430 / OCM 146 / M1) TaxID=634498 RepID=D3DZG5_METRM|nr:hypothetical protein [Methanobrevibacter ruminantium]ADC47643.1 hypothetical protein mru_1793 [Methanobrevibacter ruminantium M1]